MLNRSKSDEAVACFSSGFNCAQAVLSTYCEEFGMEKKTAMQIACGLGAGMGRQQETCGAVSGAYLLIGLKHGKFLAEDDPAKEQTYAMVRKFATHFMERNKSTRCRELLGVDLISGDKLLASEQVKTICPQVIRDAAEIIEKMLFSYPS